MKRTLILLFILTFSFSKADILMEAAKKELNRTFEDLSDKENPPYYISYLINEIDLDQVSSSFGVTSSLNSTRSRFLDIDLRVGDYDLDNTHIIRGNPISFTGATGAIPLPLEDDEISIRNAIWFATDRIYKSATERYEKVLTNQAVKVQMEDTSADFSIEKPFKFSGEKTFKPIDLKKWESISNEVSSKFSGNDWIYNGDFTIRDEKLTQTFVSTEGSEIQQHRQYIRVILSAKTKAEDGTSLPIFKTYFAFTPDELPSKETLLRDTDKLIEKLAELRDSELMSSYTGPALLSGEASGVFFHEILGHRIEGHREKDPNSSQMFKKSIGEKILPEHIDVIFDPTIKKLDGYSLSGYYEYDDEGVKSQKVVTVDDGIFRGFLMSRSPIEGFDNSNGHGRKQVGYKAVARQSNLIVKSEETEEFDELREMLREEAEEQGLEFGLYVDVVQEGFTLTGRTLPNSFNVHPVIVYKVFVDGRPDKMVRGLNLIGTPLIAFSNIIAVGDDFGVFNGICGAESGGVPVSACSPSILLSKLETQKKQKSQAKLPLLPAPETKSTP